MRVEQDHKKQRQMDLGTYFHLPTLQLVNDMYRTPSASRMK